MSIEIQALLNKMEQEILHAKRGDDSRVREHIYSVKTLCEVILEERSFRGEKTSSFSENQNVQSQRTIQNTPVSLPIQPSKPIHTEDGSNGDSIFDF